MHYATAHMDSSTCLYYDIDSGRSMMLFYCTNIINILLQNQNINMLSFSLYSTKVKQTSTKALKYMWIISKYANNSINSLIELT